MFSYYPFNWQIKMDQVTTQKPDRKNIGKLNQLIMITHIYYTQNGCHVLK